MHLIHPENVRNTLKNWLIAGEEMPRISEDGPRQELFYFVMSGGLTLLNLLGLENQRWLVTGNSESVIADRKRLIDFGLYPQAVKSIQRREHPNEIAFFHYPDEPNPRTRMIEEFRRPGITTGTHTPEDRNNYKLQQWLDLEETPLVISHYGPRAELYDFVAAGGLELVDYMDLPRDLVTGTAASNVRDRQTILEIGTHPKAVKAIHDGLAPKEIAYYLYHQEKTPLHRLIHLSQHYPSILRLPDSEGKNRLWHDDLGAAPLMNRLITLDSTYPKIMELMGRLKIDPTESRIDGLESLGTLSKHKQSDKLAQIVAEIAGDDSDAVLRILGRLYKNQFLYAALLADKVDREALGGNDPVRFRESIEHFTVLQETELVAPPPKQLAAA